jgi:hypothetical protein
LIFEERVNSKGVVRGFGFLLGSWRKTLRDSLRVILNVISERGGENQYDPYKKRGKLRKGI